jgi:hypothetical protein
MFTSKNLFEPLCRFFTYVLTDLLVSLLTPQSRVLLEKLTGSHLVKYFPPPQFYGTRSFITAFPCARHLYLY